MVFWVHPQPELCAAVLAKGRAAVCVLFEVSEPREQLRILLTMIK